MRREETRHWADGLPFSFPGGLLLVWVQRSGGWAFLPGLPPLPGLGGSVAAWGQGSHLGGS